MGRNFDDVQSGIKFFQSRDSLRQRQRDPKFGVMPDDFIELGPVICRDHLVQIVGKLIHAGPEVLQGLGKIAQMLPMTQEPQGSAMDQTQAFQHQRRLCRIGNPVIQRFDGLP